MKREYYQAVFLALIILVLVGSYFFNKNDFINGLNHGDQKIHYEKTIGESKHEYAPFYYWISYWFVESKEDFYNFNFFLFSIIGSLVFYWFCDRKLSSVFFYLALTNFSVFTLFNGSFPAGLAILFFLVFIKSRDWAVRALFFSMAYLTHNYSFILFFGAFFLEKITSKDNGFFQFIPALFPTFYPKNLFVDTIGKVNYWVSANAFFATIIGSIQQFKKNQWYFSIILFSWVASFDLIRAFNVAQLVSLAGFVDFFEEQPFDWKLIILLVSLIYEIFVITPFFVF